MKIYQSVSDKNNVIVITDCVTPSRGTLPVLIFVLKTKEFKTIWEHVTAKKLNASLPPIEELPRSSPFDIDLAFTVCLLDRVSPGVLPERVLAVCKLDNTFLRIHSKSDNSAGKLIESLLNAIMDGDLSDFIDYCYCEKCQKPLVDTVLNYHNSELN